MNGHVISLRGKLKKKDGFKLPDGVVYIGRSNPWMGLKQSIWHNPFKEGRDGTLEEVIAKYEAHVRDSPELMHRLPELRGKVLACWCAPGPCHGDVLLRLAEHRA